MKRTLLLSSTLSLALVLSLTGCNSTKSNTVSISGKAIDPYLQDATVYADTNGNGQQDANEPTASSDENGTYTLNVPDTNDTYTLYVTGGTDAVTHKDFNGTLSVVITDTQDAAEGNLTVNITPLTTLVAVRYHELNETSSIDEVKASVADYLDLNTTEIDADVVKLANDRNETKAFKTAFALEKAAEKYAIDHNASTSIFYYNMANNSKDSKTGAWIGDTNQTDLVKGIMDARGDNVQGLLEDAGFDIIPADHNSTGAKTGQDAGNTGADAGSNAGNQGASAGQNAGNAGADAGQDTGNAGSNADSNAGNQGTSAGQNAGNAGANAGQDAGNTGADAGSNAGNQGANSSDKASDTNSTGGQTPSIPSL